MHYGHIIDPSSGETIDEVLAVYMRAPHTYTGEDVAEIHCHGSVVSLRKILEKILASGAVPAEPGEFTKRAFLNGRIDLAQAGAVIDMIRAKTDRGYDAALGQLEGRLSAKISDVREILADACAEAAVNMDYPDEDDAAGDEAAARSVEARLTKAKAAMDALIATADAGRLIVEGIRAVIVGKPNVGKSSLLNALLRESRAIVSKTPGTTRDSIEEYLNIKGIPVRLTDTAGIRDAETDLEAMGIERSKDALRKADIILLTLDGSLPLSAADRKIIAELAGRLTGDRADSECGTVIAVINKRDLPEAIDRQALALLLPGVAMVGVSAITGEGTEEIEDRIVSAVYGGKARKGESVMVTNAAHKSLLLRAAASTEKALEMLRIGEALDFVETDMREAYDTLGEITGQTVTEGILDRVFSKFCVGK
jgi:tRNA modification GTPase